MDELAVIFHDPSEGLPLKKGIRPRKRDEKTLLHNHVKKLLLQPWHMGLTEGPSNNTDYTSLPFQTNCKRFWHTIANKKMCSIGARPWTFSKGPIWRGPSRAAPNEAADFPASSAHLGLAARSTLIFDLGHTTGNPKRPA